MPMQMLRDFPIVDINVVEPTKTTTLDLNLSGNV